VVPDLQSAFNRLCATLVPIFWRSWAFESFTRSLISFRSNSATVDNALAMPRFGDRRNRRHGGSTALELI
jgi:hypothetical protein